jgi:hypothetical protein
LVMDTNRALSGLEPLLSIEALAEYLEVPVTGLVRSGPKSVNSLITSLGDKLV